MKIKKILAGVLSAAMALGTLTLPAFADDTDVYEIGAGKQYENLRDAVNAAADTDNNGQITYKLFGKNTLTATSGTEWYSIKGTSDASRIDIVAGDDDAELVLSNTDNASIIIGIQNEAADGLVLNFDGLALSRENAKWTGDIAQATEMFTAFVRSANTEVNYTGCVFPQGVYNNQYGKTNFNNCIFGSDDGSTKYGLWISPDKQTSPNTVSVSESTFYGSVKIYGQGSDNTVPMTTNIEKSEFKNITKKPGIVSNQNGKVNITDTTFDCALGNVANLTHEKNQTATEAIAEIIIDGKAPEYKAFVNGSLFTDVSGADEYADNSKPVEAVVAQIGSNCYTTLSAAVSAAQADNTITLCNDVTTDELVKFNDSVTLDLNGHTLTSDYVMSNSTGIYALAFTNGGTLTDSAAVGEKGALITNKARAITSNNNILNITGATVKVTSGMSSGNAVIGTTGGLNMKDSSVIGEFEGSYAVSSFGQTGTEVFNIENSVIHATTVGIYRNGSAGKFKMTVKNSEIITESQNSNLAVYISNNNVNNDTNHEVSFENCVISGETGIEAKYTDLDLKDCDITATGTPSYVQNNNGATARGFAVVITDNAKGDVKAVPTGTVKIDGGNYTGLIGLENCADADEHIDITTDVKISGGTFDTDIKDYCEPGFSPKLINGKYVVDDSADKLKLFFKQNTDDANAYDIMLSGEGKNINRLNAADLTFKLDTIDKITYEVSAADGMSIIPQKNDRYEFHFNGKTGITTDSGAEVKIGTVKFDSYGSFKFYATDGKITATTTQDNLVTEFVSADTSNKGKLEIAGNDSIIDTTRSIPVKTLTVNVSFPHEVNENAAEYQDMTVEISGGDLARAVKTFKLGNTNSDVDANTKTVAMTNGAYTVSAELTQNITYNVTVSGAGYRTARHTVNMSDDKVLNFWNNVKSEETEVEVGNTDTKMIKNFLAGDIVKDGNINIYDLSAIVSYFNPLTTSLADKYAKYDLNRDGKIDMMDISIILTSWNE